MYKYANIELTPAIFKELLIEKFDGMQFKRPDAIKVITEYHTNNGGILEKSSYIGTFKRATKMLKDSGITNPSYGIWQLNYKEPETRIYKVEKNEEKIKADETYGEGKVAVYVYYYDVYKELAKLRGEEYFPCKIGRTDVEPLQRIISQSGTSYPERPHIALIFYCDNSSYLEATFHNVLKLKNKWIKDAPGVEWFKTNIEEIKTIYNSIINN
ncbi:MAG: GIY-YIG nuclease family protein [Bacilli bacterium]|nr:GIY-YIG nuclease family protein [Bacilli bacterium]